MQKFISSKAACTHYLGVVPLVSEHGPGNSGKAPFQTVTSPQTTGPA